MTGEFGTVRALAVAAAKRLLEALDMQARARGTVTYFFGENDDGLRDSLKLTGGYGVKPKYWLAFAPGEPEQFSRDEVVAALAASKTAKAIGGLGPGRKF